MSLLTLDSSTSRQTFHSLTHSPLSSLTSIWTLFYELMQEIHPTIHAARTSIQSLSQSWCTGCSSFGLFTDSSISHLLSNAIWGTLFYFSKTRHILTTDRTILGGRDLDMVYIPAVFSYMYKLAGPLPCCMSQDTTDIDHWHTLQVFLHCHKQVTHCRVLWWGRGVS